MWIPYITLCQRKLKSLYIRKVSSKTLTLQWLIQRQARRLNEQRINQGTAYLMEEIIDATSNIFEILLRASHTNKPQKSSNNIHTSYCYTTVELKVLVRKMCIWGRHYLVCSLNCNMQAVAEPFNLIINKGYVSFTRKFIRIFKFVK